MPWREWIQVSVGFSLMLNTWGLVNAFGVFQEYYSAFSPPLSSPSSISWIGSLQLFCLLGFGSATGSFVDRGFARRMAFVGCSCITLAIILTSLSGEFTAQKRPVFYQVILSQGVLSGIGMSLLLVPSTAIVPTYFSKNRALAVGIANSGASIGGIIYPILVRRLLVTMGFNWAMRVTALVVLVTANAATFLLRQRRELTRNPAKRTLYEFRCLLEPQYILFVLGVALSFAGLFIPYFYITTWVRDTGVSLNGMQPYYLISILNAGGLVGRIAPSIVADRLKSGPALVQSVAAIGCGALAGGWTYVDSSFPGLIVWALAYGFLSGSVISLIPATAAMLTPDMSRLGGRIGIVFAANALGSLIGNPVAGVIMKSTEGGWRGLSLYCATLELAGGSLLLPVADDLVPKSAYNSFSEPVNDQICGGLTCVQIRKECQELGTAVSRTRTPLTLIYPLVL
ncbi:MFS general substrate transporter [Aaosphaeria arxii CBS 175.79]|uniref:MFS general substrate transporter n=1 Tax=Aaosphaeria arxii CBS 175.79 TaxID=1450172 RepID=A0A6A5Y3Y5_9PLEO|nr:MFS general substrate transporter [Aaosphaeria arxii CBS 175.79]KAF2019989.1 MFS general substrate transporter [Aaosphaeria arxii CBS 175.79]